MIHSLSRLPLCLTVLLTAHLLGGNVWSQEGSSTTVEGKTTEKTTTTEQKASLQVGDRAPRLAIKHWLKGEAVESFSKEHFYVIEFWATWCGPCIKSMPHLSELATRYSKDGLVVVATTTEGDSNMKEDVEQFISGPGKDFQFRFAFSDNEEHYNAYMGAAGQNGIPCSFVVDKEGNIAYIGHPLDLDYVLERMASGKWRGKVDADELREMNDSIAKLGPMVQSDPEKALKIVEHIRRVNPQRSKSLDFTYVETMILCQNKLFDRAKELIEQASNDDGQPQDWGATAMLCGLLASSSSNPEGKHREFALAQIQKAEEALQDDWQNLFQVAAAYQLSGDMEKFKKCTERVIEKCPDEQLKKTLRLGIELQTKAAGR